MSHPVTGKGKMSRTISRGRVEFTKTSLTFKETKQKGVKNTKISSIEVRSSTLDPGSFPFKGLSESNSVSYFPLSVGVTNQLKVFVTFPTGDSNENDPAEEEETIPCVAGIDTGAGGCIP